MCIEKYLYRKTGKIIQGKSGFDQKSGYLNRKAESPLRTSKDLIAIMRHIKVKIFSVP